jgi:hypothetical protein
MPLTILDPLSGQKVTILPVHTATVLYAAAFRRLGSRLFRFKRSYWPEARPRQYRPEPLQRH